MPRLSLFECVVTWASVVTTCTLQLPTMNGKGPFGGRKVFIGGTADKDHDELLRHFSQFGEVLALYARISFCSRGGDCPRE
jgi:hypothetical protein